MTTQVPIFPAAIPKRIKAFNNGRLPNDVLVKVAPIGQGQLVEEATGPWHNLAQAFKAERGKELTATGMYRTFDDQVKLHDAKPDLAATPGESNHGWGCAVDVSVGSFAHPQSIADFPDDMEWLAVHEVTYGWSHEWSPTAKRPWGKEPWHIRLINPTTALKHPPPARPNAPDHVLRAGMEGKAVGSLQDYCRFFHFTTMATTARYDDATVSAVTKMQAEVCPPDKRPEPGVYDALTHLFFQVFLDKLSAAAHH
jgi:hypothetical protein